MNITPIRTSNTGWNEHSLTNSFKLHSMEHQQSIRWKENYSPWIEKDYILKEENMSYQSTKIKISRDAGDFIPRTSLGEKLLMLRKRAIKRGMNLLSPDEVLEEVKRRRGEIE